jgi:AcrR family transcriptional regulator
MAFISSDLTMSGKIMVRKKNPIETRKIILETAAGLLHQHGYKGLRMDEIVEQTELTKGALYHHFPNKQAIGYAVVDELLHNMFIDTIQRLLLIDGEPLEVIASSFTRLSEDMCEDEIELGCPLTNIGQEMSYEDEGFRIRIENIFDHWINMIAELIAKGIEEGSVKADLEPIKVARFIVSSVQGIQFNSKYSKDLIRFKDNIEVLQLFIRGIAV